MAKNSVTGKTLGGVGSLIKLLPTGTVFFFQFTSPLITNNGHCHPFNKALTSIVLVLCGLSCIFSCFTDSYTDHNVHKYAFATVKGLWPAPAGGDYSSYRLGLADFVHALLSTVVFAVLVLLDKNSVQCFFPSLEGQQGTLLMVLPPVIGAVASAVFAIFPTTRHGVGYPLPPQNQSSLASEMHGITSG